MSFTAPLWRVDKPGGWYFVSIPDAHAPERVGPWGRTPVVATVNGARWETSAWHDTKNGWLLPIPADRRADLDVGDLLEVDIEPGDS